MSTAKSAFLSATLALLLVASGCSLFSAGEEDPYPSLRDPIDFSRFSQAPPLLVGRWEWQESIVYGPGEPGRSTPSTTGHTETLVFPAPPDSVRVYQNDTLYQHTARDTFFGGARWGVHDDTLVTSTVYIDGPQKIYERVE